MKTEAQPLIGVKEIAAYIYRSERTVKRMLKRGDIPARKIGGLWETDSATIDRWRKCQEVT